MLINSLIIILQDPPSSCCGVGNCTTPTTAGLYNTIHHRRDIDYSPVAVNTIHHRRDVDYSPVAINTCLYGQSLRPKRLQYSSVIGREECDSGDYRPDIPLLEQSTVVLPSSNLTLSDTDTSLISSERDQESEV